MRDLALKCMVLAGLVGLSCALIVLSTDQTQRERIYLAGTIYKQRMLREVKSPKVVLVGGSSAAYGVDSELIQRRTGQRVVNMGLHGGLGLKYMLEEVRPYIREGDLVVVIPEYENFAGEKLLDGRSEVWEVVRLSGEGFRDVKDVGQYFAMANSLQTFLMTRFSVLRGMLSEFVKVHVLHRSAFNSVYDRDSFNDCGDYVGHLGKPRLPKIDYVKSRCEELNEEAFSVLAEFCGYVDRRGALAVVSWPSIAEPGYALRKDFIQRVVRKMSDYPTIRVAGEPLEYVLPVDDFYDTEYHLASEGRRKRTLKLLQVVKEFIDSHGLLHK